MVSVLSLGWCHWDPRVNGPLSHWKIGHWPIPPSNSLRRWPLAFGRSRWEKGKPGKGNNGQESLSCFPFPLSPFAPLPVSPAPGAIAQPLIAGCPKLGLFCPHSGHLTCVFNNLVGLLWKNLRSPSLRFPRLYPSARVLGSVVRGSPIADFRLLDCQWVSKGERANRQSATHHRQSLSPALCEFPVSTF